MTRRTSTLVSAGVAGLLALSAFGASPSTAAESVIFSETFESCTSASATPFDPIDGLDNEGFGRQDGNIDRTSTARGLPVPISVQLYTSALSCPGWTPRSQAWLTVKDAGADSGPAFPSGTKAVWLNEGPPTGGITRTVPGLVVGNTYRVSVEAWTDNFDAATALGVNIGGGTTANMNLVMAAGSGIQTVQTEFCSTSTSITVDAFENGSTGASPVIDDFTVTDLGVSCTTFFLLSASSSSINGTVGSAITPLTFSHSGLRGTVTYSAVGLPAGLSINPSTGEVSGTPLAGQAEQSYTITARGADSGVASTSVTITVDSAGTPPSLSPATQTVSATEGSAITPTSALTPTGLTAPITYSVSPGLPDGLTLNTSTGVISGTPTTQQSSLAYTIRASGGGLTADSTVNIAIAAGGGSGGGSGGSGGSDSGGASSGLPNTGTSLMIIGITLGSALMLYIAGLFVFRGRRQLGFAAVNEKVSARMQELDAMLTRMEERARRRRIRRRS